MPPPFRFSSLLLFRFLRVAFLHCGSLEELRREALNATKDALDSCLGKPAMPEKHAKQVTLMGFHNGRVEYLQEIWLEHP